MEIGTAKARNSWDRNALGPRPKTPPAWKALVGINHANSLHHGRFNVLKAFPNHLIQALHRQTVVSQIRLLPGWQANEEPQI
jgi:hypothetical protein